VEELKSTMVSVARKQWNQWHLGRCAMASRSESGEEDGGVVQRQRRPGSGASRCWLCPSLDRIRVVGGCGGSR
jgi:hypothetical protein